jgi:glycosyltransferase involved in cell wall biosynthesis
VLNGQKYGLHPSKTHSKLPYGRANMRLVCLLPVRNGSADLPLYLESVSGYVDAVIALDDGSTDDTYRILKDSNIVKTILQNPRRDSYVGWNDLRNRMQLLDSAESENPDWIIWLDADELLEPSDAAILRQFIETEAKLRRAYSFEVLRMINDLTTYDKCKFWVPRMYSYQKGYTLPERDLHFYLVPNQFENPTPINTSLRIMHKAGVTETRRLARYQKYNECDPDRKWQESYENLLTPVGNPKLIKPRKHDEPVVLST